MNDTNLPGSPAPVIVERAKAILVSPNTEWPKIASEDDSVRDVFMRYVVPLAAIGPIAGFIGGQLFGIGAFGFRYHPSLMAGLSTAITGYVLGGLLMTFVVAWVASFLADKFGGQAGFPRAFRLCAYAFTASWVAGILQLVPSLAVLGLIAGLYGIYLFYLGATPMMSVPKDKSAGYTAVTIVAVIVVYLVIGAVTTAVVGTFGMTSAIAANSDDGTGNVEVNLPGYGKVKVEDNGDKQTMEIPGVGKVEVTKNGDTVNIQGDSISATVKDPSAADSGN